MHNDPHPGLTEEPLLEFATDVVVIAPPTKVLDAFFDSKALATWWQAKHSVCVPRLLGSYAIEWEPTEWRDDVLGRLGGALHATVMEYKPGREFFLADAYWLPPDGDPIGPMALDVMCTAIEAAETEVGRPVEIATRLRVHQSGFEEGARWRRYYEVATVGWERALASLKMLSEKDGEGRE